LHRKVWSRARDYGDKCIPLSDVALISYAAALESLEALRLSRLQNAYVNAQKGEQLEALLYRERLDIEGLQGMAQRRE